MTIDDKVFNARKAEVKKRIGDCETGLKNLETQRKQLDEEYQKNLQLWANAFKTAMDNYNKTLGRLEELESLTNPVPDKDSQLKLVEKESNRKDH